MRNRIEQFLLKHNIQCSIQVVNALHMAAAYSSPEISGCSDSLLFGLLKSGSYTIDALIDSGVDTAKLADIAYSSVQNVIEADEEIDAVEMLFAPHGVLGSYLKYMDSESDFLEASTILELAISPESLDGSFADWFPKELCASPNSTTGLLNEIENQVCYAIEACADIISKRPEITLRKRRKQLANIEIQKITKEFSESGELNQEDIDWAISLTNEWVVNRRLNIANPRQTLRIIDAIYQDVRIGSSMFMDSGGDFTTLT